MGLFVAYIIFGEQKKQNNIISIHKTQYIGNLSEAFWRASREDVLVNRGRVVFQMHTVPYFVFRNRSIVLLLAVMLYYQNDVQEHDCLAIEKHLEVAGSCG
jgi:hypothetical protein